MDFHEKTIESGGDCSAGEDRGEFAISAGGTAESAGALHGMGGVENHRDTFFAHDVKRAHIDHQIVVSKSRAALGDEEAITSERPHFIGDVHAIPRREELAFFHVHDATSFRRGFEKIGLAAEESGDLEEIDVFRSDLRLLGGMDIGGDGDFELLGNFTEDAATFDNPGAAEGIHGRAVGLVERRFENEGDSRAISDFFQRTRHFPGKRLRLKRTRAKDEKGDGSTDGDLGDLEWGE